MGIVYLAEDILLGRQVAIKTLTAAVAPGRQHFRTRFLREARAVSALNHPHIATIFDYGEMPDGQPFIVMELIKGQTLADILQGKELTLARAVRLVGQVAEALAEAHRHGIVHRDIKPSNIAVNERGEVKVLDFGLAKQVNAADENHPDAKLQALLNTQTREGVVIGTPMYLSPEQAMGLSVDQRSDIFSAGALLYECIAGRPAFIGLSPVDICAQVIRDDPPPPSLHNPRVPPELDRIVRKAMAKKVDERYRSAEELRVDLQSVQSALQDGGVGQSITHRIRPARSSARTAARSTLSDIFYRPRLPIGGLLVGLVAACFIAGALWWLARPVPHQPKPEALRLFNIGTDAIREGTYYKARKALERAVAVDDKFALAHARLAEAWMELDYTDRAKDELLIVNDKLASGISTLSRPDALYLDAIKATVRRDLERAVKSYAEIADLKPDDPQTYVDLGRAYEKKDEAEKAIDSYAKAVHLDPANAAALLRLGILYGRRDDAANAVAAFDKAGTLYQDSSNFEGAAEVFCQRGSLYSQLGKLDDANAQLQRARDIAQINNNTYQQIRILLELTRVAYSKGDTARAKELATGAVDLAKANGIENLITQGLHDLGYIFLVSRAYADAEQYFMQSLDYAQRYKGENNEARVMLSIGNLYIQQELPDQGLPRIEQALSYYRAGGYRKETARCLIMLGRAKLLKGDYEAALRIFDEQLQLAKQIDNPAQVARSQSEIGSALAKQEVYPAALRHFNESYESYSRLGNPLNAGFSLLNKFDMLARLGRHEEAHASLDQLLALINQLSDDNNNKQVWRAWAHLISARIALSERRLPEAREECLRAINATMPRNKNTLAVAKGTLGLIETFSGKVTAGRKLCEEAVSIAAQANDARLLSDVRLILAEALLAAGQGREAAAAGLHALEAFARQHKQESEWRARLIVARAYRLAGNHEAAQENFARAGDTLSLMQKAWDAEAFATYRLRPDIQAYFKYLTEPPAPAGAQVLR